MPQNANGRDARLYVAAVSYDGDGDPEELEAADLIEVLNLQAIRIPDVASEAEVKARDLSHVLTVLGDKQTSIETDMPLQADESADHIAFLQARYDDGAPFWAIVTREAYGVESGDGVILIGNLSGWPESIPDVGPIPVSLVIKPAEAA